jgi:hypothetical protein
MRSLLRKLRRSIGNDGAIENARRDADELMRMLAAVDALALRVAARTQSDLGRAA